MGYFSLQKVVWYRGTFVTKDSNPNKRSEESDSQKIGK